MKIKKLIEFPETRQSTNFSCGASSVQAVLYFYGISIREDNLIQQMDVKPTSIEHSGVPPQKIVSFLSKKGLNAPLHQRMTISQLKKLIDKNIPVIIAIQAWDSKNESNPKEGFYSNKYTSGHYIVAIGYGFSSSGEPAIIFDDPSLLSNHGWMTEKELLTRWHDKDSEGNFYNHLGIPVSGKEKTYKKTSLKKIL